MIIPPNPGGAEPGCKVRVNHLWKVFGPIPHKILQSEWREHSRAAVLAQTKHVVAVRDVTFSVNAGETFVIMGLSGSGKSTLVRCLTRLVEPSEGTIYLDDHEVTAMSERELTRFRRGRVGMVFQHFGLLPHRRVIDNAAWGLEVQGISETLRHRQAAQMLDFVGLNGWENYYPDELSGGMQQRVGLARALAIDPDVLLMDEPFSGLDPVIRRDLQDELLRLQATLQKTIIFITHDLNEALKLGTRIMIMRDGEIIQVGDPEEILSAPADDYVREFIKDIPLSNRTYLRQAAAAPALPMAVD